MDEGETDLDSGFPDVYELLQIYNQCFFDGLLGGVELKWSTRMTLCAGLCSYKDGLITLKLSEPLLKLRPISDLQETLLHEMIHAYLMVTGQEMGRDGHGDSFLAMMLLINNTTGLHISVYHSFLDEVDFYRKHVWRCSGPCKARPPYFGFVRRAMNRAPSNKDHWWSRHEIECGGTFQKESGPAPPPPKRKRPVSHLVTKYFKRLPNP